MELNTILFIKKKFQEHYRKEPPEPPPCLEKREWGFLMFDPDSGMRRHKAFISVGEMQEYIQAMAPAHVYHSTAYYQHPGAPTMKEKNWEGADLIFDIDADHLPVKTDSFKAMLDAAKQEIIKLVGFLMDDFGFGEESLHIAFSGGRGYHVHVRDPRVLILDSAQRREIIDYLETKGLDKKYFISRKLIRSEIDFGDKSYTEDYGKKSTGTQHKISRSGWGKHILDYFSDYLEGLSKLDDDEIIKILKNLGIKRKKQRNNIISVCRNKKSIHNFKQYGEIDIAQYSEKFFDLIIEKAINENKVILGGAYVDEPVTADIKRLIRAASSLHGKSGMKVVTLTVDELHRFEPLVDAVVFGDNEIKINVTRPTTVEMMDEQFEVEEGANVLPEYAAIYLMCKGAAEYMGGVR